MRKVLDTNVLLFPPRTVALVFGLSLAMGRNDSAQKGSCCWKCNKCALLLSDCCSLACRETSATPEQTVPNPTQPEPSLTQLGWHTHQRMKLDCFIDEALPSKGKMECNRSGKAYLDKATARTIQLDLDNPAIDRAIAECCQAMCNRDMAPDASSKVSTISLLKGGKSKGAPSKQRQTLGAIINSATKSFS
jgi:hypothetical protein